jgi:hypothetical protein
MKIFTREDWIRPQRIRITGNLVGIRTSYLSRGDHGEKIRSRKQRTDIGKYSFVNRTIQLWNLQML